MRGWEFSPKQRTVMNWWMDGSPHRDKTVILCDGAVRSGKTLALGMGFFLWAMTQFREKKFGLCGKSVEGLRRNLLTEVLPWLEALGYRWRENRSENVVTVRRGKWENRFYIFGGCDEGAAARIQGITLAGVLLDEAALMPRSFVEQAWARCSVEGSRIWLSCNPAGPGHWLYREWVCRAQERGCLRLHFTMEDNPGLSPAVRQRYERLYSGVFYRRYVLGQWVQAEGLVYDFFTREMVQEAPQDCGKWYISCDYGTVNPMSMGLWGEKAGVWYRVKEFYFDSRREGRQMTDGEYARELERLAGGRRITAVIVDPSAASFQEVLKRQGWRVKKARNEVLSGIRVTAELLKQGKIVLCRGCGDCLREMEEYRWDLEHGGDRVCKENDHAMDDMRYFAATVVREGGVGAAAWAVARRRG